MSCIGGGELGGGGWLCCYLAADFAHHCTCTWVVRHAGLHGAIVARLGGRARAPTTVLDRFLLTDPRAITADRVVYK